MKKIILSIFILMLCGCWNYKELNDYSIVTGMAIDYTDNKYMVSFLIANSKNNSDANSNQYESILYSSVGETIYEAIKNIWLISPKQLYIGHLESVVISEEVAKLGLYNSLEFLLEDSRSNKNFYIVLAKDCMAKDVLSITTPITDISSESVSDNVNSSYKLHGSILSKTFNDIIYELINDGIDTAISSYVIIGDVKEGSSLENLESTSPNTYIKLDDLGIFNGDKLVAWANKDISRGINIINNDVVQLYIDIDCDGGHIIVNTTDIKTKNDISKDRIIINTKGNASISEITCDVDLEDDKIIKEMEKNINKKVENLIRDSFNFSRNYNSDVFGFGLSFYRNNPNEYKDIDFNEIYFNIEPEINVDINIRSSGNLNQSIERIANNED